LRACFRHRSRNKSWNGENRVVEELAREGGCGDWEDVDGGLLVMESRKSGEQCSNLESGSYDWLVDFLASGWILRTFTSFYLPPNGKLLEMRQMYSMR
jgi:hypothetical protein